MRLSQKSFKVYVVLRILVILTAIRVLLWGNYEGFFLCILSLILFLLPSFFAEKLKLYIPPAFEIIIYLFIYAAEILGEVDKFYTAIPGWDTMLHTLNGFLCAALGVSLVEILNNDKRIPFQMSPFFMAMVSFCFSMTVGVLWEFFEFGMDTIFLLDMQKDTVITQITTTYLDPTKQNLRVVLPEITQTAVNGQVLDLEGYLDIGLIDTMEDLLVNFIGAFVFAILQYIYGKHGDKRIFKNLVPFLQEKDKYEKLQENIEKE